MKKSSLLPILSLLLLYGVISTAHSNSESSSIVHKTALLEWGYNEVGFSSIEQTTWEKDNYGVAVIHQQEVKAINEVPGWPRAFYRFTITRAVFSNEASALKRVKDIHAYPPEVDIKMQPEYILRQGFRTGKTVYFLSTDVVQFEREELPRILKLLKRHIESTS